MMVLNIIIILFFIIGVATVAAVISFEAVPKVQELMDRQCKIRFLCKHEYVKKTTWRVFEHKFSNNSNLVEEINMQCRKCGKKKTIKFYEEEVE